MTFQTSPGAAPVSVLPVSGSSSNHQWLVLPRRAKPALLKHIKCDAATA